MQSERNLRFVFDTLNLASDPDYSGSGFNLIAWLQSFIPARFLPPPLSPEQQAARDREMAYENFASRVLVKRLAQSYAFDVSFRALSAQKAAQITNSIVAAYIRDQVIYNVAAATAQRGGDFLQNRIADSKTEVETATNAVKTGIIPNFVFGHADSRIVSAASEPLTKTYPMTMLVLALSVVFALISGVGAVMARQGLDRRIHSLAQVRKLSGVDAIAAIPDVRAVRRRRAELARFDRSSRFAVCGGLARIKSAYTGCAGRARPRVDWRCVVPQRRGQVFDRRKFGLCDRGFRSTGDADRS